MSERLISDQREVRYGEVFCAFMREGRIEIEVYGTQLLNECPQELWDTLDPDNIAEEMEATFVKLNGPRQWVLDGLGTKLAPVEPVLHEFNGLLMRRIAVIDLGTDFAADSYVERQVDRRATFFWDVGKPVFELVNPEGVEYVMQALCQGVDPSITLDSLEGLGSRLALPTGWEYRTRILDEELVVDTTDRVAVVLQDEFENTYTTKH